MVKNTDEIVGVVVYAGMDTKILLNLNKVRHKVSRVERKVHVIQLVLFCVLFLLCLTASLLYYRDFKPWHSRDNIFYLRNKHHWTIKKDGKK
jgi:magnesium-transporting ATPase (P-type)